MNRIGARIISQDREKILDEGSKIENRLVIIFMTGFCGLLWFPWCFFLLPFFLIGWFW